MHFVLEQIYTEVLEEKRIPVLQVSTVAVAYDYKSNYTPISTPYLLFFDTRPERMFRHATELYSAAKNMKQKKQDTHTSLTENEKIRMRENCIPLFMYALYAEDNKNKLCLDEQRFKSLTETYVQAYQHLLSDDDPAFEAASKFYRRMRKNDPHWKAL